MKDGDGTIHKTSVMKVLCQPVLSEIPVESNTESTPHTRDQLKQALEAWKQEFLKQNGRQPSKDELFADPTAGSLFREFVKLRR